MARILGQVQQRLESDSKLPGNNVQFISRRCRFAARPLTEMTD